ncbi:MAG: hypothetical protein KH230_16900 [Enterocloster asparagiformis]|nr:hypothetical protein [Enterocloster asparagiformis]
MAKRRSIPVEPGNVVLTVVKNGAKVYFCDDCCRNKTEEEVQEILQRTADELLPKMQAEHERRLKAGKTSKIAGPPQGGAGGQAKEENMKNAWLTEQDKDLRTKGEYTADVEMTEKQAINLNLLAYKAGYSSPKELLETMIGDLTGVGETSPCPGAMRQWYAYAHEEALKTYRFRFYLYNYDYTVEHLRKMLADMNIFVTEYQEYCDTCADEDLEGEPWERCLEVTKEICEEGGFL